MSYINREEAIRLIMEYQGGAMDKPTARKVLEEMDGIEICEDTISRQAAIDAMCELMRHWFGGDPKDEVREINRELGKLPSAQPERKMGKWIYNSPVTMKCDQCGFVIKDWDWHRFKFCPNCDCDMRGEQE